MVWQTSYSHYSNEELLRYVDDKRGHSPIIEELCQRLEKKTLKEETQAANNNVECPVCESQLVVDYDQGNNIFDLDTK
jgi:hypothetical protein